MKTMPKILMVAVVAWLFIPCSVLLAQKPVVAAVVWDNRAKEGEDLGELRIYQLGDPVPGLTVKISYEGTASDGYDYRCQPNVFQVDQYKQIVIRPIHDSVVEGIEVVTVRILEDDAYEIDPEHKQASVIIQDGDIPDVEFRTSSSISDEAVEEAEVAVSLSRTWEEDIEIEYSVQGVLAVEGEDFQFDSHKLVIPAGESGASIKFRVMNDGVPEDEETVVIRLLGATSANIATIESHYYTIRNDDGEPARSGVHDKISGAVLGFRAGCSMGAFTEYNWPQDRIQEIFGYVDSFHPFKHYGDTWTHPAGATEDGGERHKLLCTAIIEKQDRISYQELKDVWLRDCEMEDMEYMTQNYDRVLLAFAWGAVYNAAMALALLPDATVESVIEGALAYATPEIEEEIRYVLAITEKYEDPMNRDFWQELTDVYMDPESRYNAFNRIEQYPNSSIYENVGFAFALFKATQANVKQSVIIATNRGYDTDCTAASAAALCGSLTGTSTIPIEWIETLDTGIAKNPYTNAHFTNKATADGLYRALQSKVYRMEVELRDKKSDSQELSKVELKQRKDYVKLMKHHGVIE